MTEGGSAVGCMVEKNFKIFPYKGRKKLRYFQGVDKNELLNRYFHFEDLNRNITFY